MALDGFEVATVLTGALMVLLLARPRPPAVLGGAGWFPRRFDAFGPLMAPVPPDALRPLAYLTERLGFAGFSTVGLPLEVAGPRRGGRFLLAPFVHSEERALFVMGIEVRRFGPCALMLHIVTPLAGGRRVETTTLPWIDTLPKPPGVEARVVLDADTVEEIWSRHRLALMGHARADREPVPVTAWQDLAASAYEAWLLAAFRAELVEVEPDGATVRVR